MTRHKAIILRRKPSPDDSLWIDTLLENGEFGAFKIPGILKSAKRSSFHYAPGGIYEMIYAEAGGARIIPKSSELVFSPFKDTQDYNLLAAVAEIVQIAEFIRPSPDNAELFVRMEAALNEIVTASIDLCLDAYYWDFLVMLGLAADAESDAEYAGYDLAAGFLTERELAERPRGDFFLPYAWISRTQRADSKFCRETIRRFLRSL